MTLYAPDDWGFADSNGGSGVTPVADIKAAIAQYGAVGCGFATDDAFQAYAGGVFTDSAARQIDHDVMLVGWDDASNAWILRNSWGTAWGEAGYMRIDYAANAVGTEAVWAVKYPAS